MGGVGKAQAWAALEGKQGDAKKAQRLFEAAAKAEPGNPKLLNAWATFEKCVFAWLVPADPPMSAV